MKKHLWLGWSGVAFTLASAILSGWLLVRDVLSAPAIGWGVAAELAVFLFFVYFMIYGSLVFQLTRLAHFKRSGDHRPASDLELLEIFKKPEKPLTFLIPSYKEEPRVVWRALASAALQEHPDRRVVLLIDDPPFPKSPGGSDILRAARRLPEDIESWLEEPRRLVTEGLAKLDVGALQNELSFAEGLAGIYERAAAWFVQAARAHAVVDHSDRLFVDQVLLARSRAHRSRAESLRKAKAHSRNRLQAERCRLESLFRVPVSSFERKLFLNLSHEPNKAMNLNAYLGLMGERLAVKTHQDGLHLLPATGLVDFVVPPADFVITLDADSILFPEYAAKLIEYMERPGNERVAVAQTPYSAYPGAPGELERIAGATTDIQYIIHQGFTAFGATFWVGANAALRKAALDDIAVVEDERGFKVRKFIQDRTVIEDTESSVDLVAKGWKLYNYPDRLSYSATPPDFGSLLIQRRRWANGGLIILPKLLQHLFSRPFSPSKCSEGFMRFHYLASITGVNVGLLLLLAVPFSHVPISPWLMTAAVPYFLFYALDLRRLGYGKRDVLRVYALNLLLIPVNLGGVIASLRQAITGKKSPFGRTPKVANRTATPAFYLALVYALLVHWILEAEWDFLEGRSVHGVLGIVNAAFLLYAIWKYVGFSETMEDLRLFEDSWKARLQERRARQPASAIARSSSR